MKIKTQDLAGPALDWAVELIECDGAMYSGREMRPFSTDWAHGGPIIQRERIGIDGMGIDNAKPGEVEAFKWAGDEHEPLPLTAVGPTPLIAAMRCYVSFTFGDEIDVPNELIEV